MECPTHLQPSYLRSPGQPQNANDNDNAPSSGDSWFMTEDHRNDHIGDHGADETPPAYRQPSPIQPATHEASADSKGNPFVLTAPPPPPPNLSPPPHAPHPPAMTAPTTPPIQTQPQPQPRPQAFPTQQQPYKPLSSSGSGPTYGHWDSGTGLFAQRKGTNGMRIYLMWTLFFVSVITVCAAVFGTMSAYAARRPVPAPEYPGLNVNNLERARDHGMPRWDAFREKRDIYRPIAHDNGASEAGRQQPNPPQQGVPVTTSIVFPASQRVNLTQIICTTTTTVGVVITVATGAPRPALVRRQQGTATATGTQNDVGVTCETHVFENTPVVNGVPGIFPPPAAMPSGMGYGIGYGIGHEGSARMVKRYESHGPDGDGKNTVDHKKVDRGENEAGAVGVCLRLGCLAVMIALILGLA